MTTQLREFQTRACQDYFGNYLPGLYGELLLPGLRTLTCALGVHVVDQGDSGWTLVIESGRLVALRPGVPCASCVFRLDTDTLLEIATGVLPPDKAFFDLRIEIDGDMALGLQLSTVLEPFFQLYPFHYKHS